MAKEEPTPRSFNVFLAQVNDGELHTDLSKELHELVTKLRKNAGTHGKAKGSLTLKLDIDVEGKGIVTVTPAINCVDPKTPRSKAVFWLDDDDHLVVENPKQQKLPIRDVSTDAKPARNA